MSREFEIDRRISELLGQRHEGEWTPEALAEFFHLCAERMRLMRPRPRKRRRF